MARIAIAGFQHETNTFGVTQAAYRDFEMADSWPGLQRGADVITATAGLNLPIAGFVTEARLVRDVELVPILWCAAEPSAHVTDEAFERIGAMLLEGLRDAGAIDGIYLDLHGAMVTASFEDGEGELLRRIRSQVGPDLPVAVSLDLHANITPQLVRHATSLAIFRTYPHLDMASTGARCFAHLMLQIGGLRPCKAFRQLPYLIPLPAQYTGADPCRRLFRLLEGLDSPAKGSADIALGFTAADMPDAGPSIVAYADTQGGADRIADRLLEEMIAAEPEFDTALLSAADAVRLAMSNRSDKPAIIADVQDNPGAGATSDTTGLLFALREQAAQGVVLGLMHDPEMAGRARQSGVGTVVSGGLGGKSGLPGQDPFEGRFRVEALSDGRCAYSGEMYGGGIGELGACAVLRVLETAADIRVVVSSQRSQCLDLAQFTQIGIEPREARIVCVKSTVHFRADFEPIASRILAAAVPGAFPCKLDQVPYRRLRKGVRLGPGGAAFCGGIDRST